jgi:hypothetical protein
MVGKLFLILLYVSVYIFIIFRLAAIPHPALHKEEASVYKVVKLKYGHDWWHIWFICGHGLFGVQTAGKTWEDVKYKDRITVFYYYDEIDGMVVHEEALP